MRGLPQKRMLLAKPLTEEKRRTLKKLRTIAGFQRGSFLSGDAGIYRLYNTARPHKGIDQDCSGNAGPTTLYAFSAGSCQRRSVRFSTRQSMRTGKGIFPVDGSSAHRLRPLIAAIARRSSESSRAAASTARARSGMRSFVTRTDGPEMPIVATAAPM
jgi:hypothetical protein